MENQEYRYKAWTPTLKLMKEWHKRKDKLNEALEEKEKDVIPLKDSFNQLAQELEIVSRRLELKVMEYNKKIGELHQKNENWFSRCKELMLKEGIFKEEDFKNLNLIYNEKKLEVQPKTIEEEKRDSVKSGEVKNIIFITDNKNLQQNIKELEIVKQLIQRYGHTLFKYLNKENIEVIKEHLRSKGHTENSINRTLNMLINFLNSNFT